MYMYHTLRKKIHVITAGNSITFYGDILLNCFVLVLFNNKTYLNSIVVFIESYFVEQNTKNLPIWFHMN